MTGCVTPANDNSPVEPLPATGTDQPLIKTVANAVL